MKYLPTSIHIGALIVLLGLIGSAAYLQSWTAVALVFIGVVAHIGLIVLDRLAPEKMPVPTGDEIMQKVQEHQAATKAELERMQSVLNMATARPRMLRE